MKTLKSLLSNSITWSFADGARVLKSDDEIILKLIPEKSGRCYFELNGEYYVIHTEGLWNSKTVIKKDDKQLMILRRNASGGNGKLEFSNGRLHVNKIRNSFFEQLLFLSDSGNRILKYDLQPKLKQKTILEIFEKLMDTNEFIMAVVLGFYSFKKVINEKPVNTNFSFQPKSFTRPQSKAIV
jgi:hypothetical protein